MKNRKNVIVCYIGHITTDEGKAPGILDGFFCSTAP